MLEYHPLANLFPLIEGRAFEDLVADVQANGIREPIILLDGKILDGRNRYRAGMEAALIARSATPDSVFAHRWFEVYDTERLGDPLAWVLSKNLHRRHLNESQRAAVAAKLETLSHGGDRQPHPAHADPSEQDANLHIDRRTAADLLNVSPRSVASAKKLLQEGAPELIEKVEQGEVAVSVAEKLLVLPKARQTEIVREVDARRLRTVAKQVSREDKERELGDRQRALPNRQYGVILADPAWRFEPYSRVTGMDRAPENHYPTQETDEIIKLPVGTLAARDCVLFLWATAPMLPDALRVMRFWGFEYRSHIVWRKAEKHAAGLVLGTGYWFRNGHELLLLGVKGDIPAPAMGSQWPSVFDAPPRRHSQKPDQVYELIESYFPSLPKIELNARAARAGWDRWGNEAPEDAAHMATDVAHGTGGGFPTAAAPLNAEEVGQVDGAVSPSGEVSTFAGATINPVKGKITPVTNPALAAYLSLVAADMLKGQHRQKTAEPIVRAAYACDPIIPTATLAGDLGHPKGTVLTWAHRLGLTDSARVPANMLASGNPIRAGRRPKSHQGDVGK